MTLIKQSSLNSFQLYANQNRQSIVLPSYYKPVISFTAHNRCYEVVWTNSETLVKRCEWRATSLQIWGGNGQGHNCGPKGGGTKFFHPRGCICWDAIMFSPSMKWLTPSWSCGHFTQCCSIWRVQPPTFPSPTLRTYVNESVLRGCHCYISAV